MTGGGREYGTALFELVAEEGCCEEISRGLSFVSSVFAEAPDYLEFLSSPAIPKGERVEHLTRILAGAVPDYVLHTLCVLVEHDRIREYAGCADEFEFLYRESNKRSQATVTSAVELTDEEKEKLRAALSKRSGNAVELHYAIDPTLLGGLIVEMDGTRMDGSLRHRLQEIKEVMTHAPDAK